MHAIAQRRLLSSSPEPLVDIHCGLRLLSVNLERRLQQRVPQSECQRETPLKAPGILQIVFKLVVLEFAIQDCALGQQTRRASAGCDLVIGLRCHQIQKACKIAHRKVVRVREAAGDRWVSECCWIEALPGVGNAGMGQRIGVGVTIAVGESVGAAVIENQPVIGAELNRMRSARQGHIVDDVMNRDVDKCGPGLGIERADVVEVRVLSPGRYRGWRNPGA